MPRVAALSLLGLVWSVGCVEAVEPSPDPPNEPAPDLSAELFDPDHIVEVSIALSDADWDELRFQTRTIVDIFGGDCLAQPFSDPFTYFPATVTLDGQELPDVGVRKKGFLGSLNSDKPSLKLKLDEYVPDARFKGMSRITLNNNAQDPSAIRQCLGYGVFARAGVVASRCNFAHVVVNGVDLGVFTHVEGLDQEFLARRFDDDSGDLWEGTLSDFRPDWMGTFDKKTHQDTLDLARIEAVAAAASAPDATLVARLEEHIDVDAFLTLWATEVLLGHWDGYAGNANNFYLYDDPTSGKLQFIPWGIDQTFMNGPQGEPPPAVNSVGVLAQRLLNLDETRAAYTARMRELLDVAWDEPSMLAEIDRMTALLQPRVPPQTLTAIEDVRAYVQGRRAAVTAALDAGLAASAEPLRAPFCFEDIGGVSGTFATTWGTLGNDDIFNTGTGTLSAEVRGNALAPSQVGSRVGADPEHAGRAALQVFALLPDNSVAAALFDLDVTAVAAGSVDLDGSDVVGYLIRFVPQTGANELLGVIATGTLSFDAAESTEGAAVRGSFAAELYWLPF